MSANYVKRKEKIFKNKNKEDILFSDILLQATYPSLRASSVNRNRLAQKFVAPTLGGPSCPQCIAVELILRNYRNSVYSQRGTTSRYTIWSFNSESKCFFYSWIGEDTEVGREVIGNPLGSAWERRASDEKNEEDKVREQGGEPNHLQK